MKNKQKILLNIFFKARKKYLKKKSFFYNKRKFFNEKNFFRNIINYH